MEGPRPKFARPDGGEGGSHPSNVHDHVYAIGARRYLPSDRRTPTAAELGLCEPPRPQGAH